MRAAREVADLLDRASSEPRQDRKAEAVNTIRFLERRIVSVLAGRELRGLRSIVPPHVPVAPFYAANVTEALSDRGVDKFLPRVGRTLLIGKAGSLIEGWRDGGPIVCWQPAKDEHLRLSDLPLFVHAARQVLERHLRLEAQRGAADQRAGELLDRLRSVM